MKRYVIYILMFMLWYDAAAQPSLSLYYMESVPQSSLLNPAHQPRCNMFITVASMSLHTETNIKASKLYSKTNDKWNFITDKDFDYSDLRRRFKRGARLNNQWSVELGNVGWRDRNGYWSIGISERFEASAALPSALFTMLDKGLPDGTRLKFNSLRINAQAYHEFAVGYSLKLTEELTVGARAKYLSGITAVRTDIPRFSVNTGRDQWDIDIDASISASFPIEVNTDADGSISIDSIEMKEMDLREALAFALPGIRNPGAAVDLGMEYSFNKNFKVSAAVTDLGLIFWTGETNTVKAKSSFTYTGPDIDLDEFFDGTDMGELLTDLGDSVKNSLTTSVTHKFFTTGVHPNIYIGGEYTPLHFLSLGLVSRTTFWKSSVSQNFNFSVNVVPYKFFSLTTGMNIDVKGCCTANFGFSLNLGPLQYYLMTNGLPVAYRKYNIDGDKVFAPNNVCDFNISTGLNLIFGAKGFKDKPMINTYSEF